MTCLSLAKPVGKNSIATLGPSSTICQPANMLLAASLAFGMFTALIRRGKSEVAFATPLANFAIRRVLAGRQVGTKPKLHDVLAPQAQSA
jgi:hypothetical protein